MIELLGGKGSQRYEYYKNSFFQAIYRGIKKWLGVPSYRDILKKDYEAVVNYIKGWIPEVEVIVRDCV